MASAELTRQTFILYIFFLADLTHPSAVANLDVANFDDDNNTNTATI